MTRRFPKALFRGCDELFSGVRAIKTEEEIVVMRKAAQAAEKAIWDAIHMASAGDRERDLYRNLVNVAIQQGADLVKAVQLGSGERARYVWGCYPSEKTLQVGDVVRIEARLQGVQLRLSQNGRRRPSHRPSENRSMKSSAMGWTRSRR